MEFQTKELNKDTVMIGRSDDSHLPLRHSDTPTLNKNEKSDQ